VTSCSATREELTAFGLGLIRSCYHADAHDDHGAFRGDVGGFLDWVRDALSYFDSTMHFIGNQLIDVEGDVAHTESYCVAYHRRGPATVKTHTIW
jgi:hypothetical protein